MFKERITDPDARELVELAIIDMKAAIAGFYGFPNAENLLNTSLYVWEGVNSSEKVRLLIEEEIRQKRIILNQFATLDIGKDGDPVRRRYDPNLWQGNIPKQFEFNKGGYILERSESLLQFLESFIAPNT